MKLDSQQIDQRRGWSLRDMPDLSGRVAIVTGANAGVGYETALALAAAGAEVIVAARNAERGQAAVHRIQAKHPRACVTFEPLDLASLTSVADFAGRMAERHPCVDLLINNAGLASPPKRLTTRDGFELQFGTNFLGHFVLDAHLLPLLRQAAAPRVVTVSSLMHKCGTIDFSDLQSEHRYSPVRSYSQSKLANLIFARELQRRSDASGWGLLSAAVHPGVARTELTQSRPGQPVLRMNALGDLIAPLFAGTALSGALPTLYTATASTIAPSGYYGPTGWGEIKGPPGPARSTPASQNPEIAARLWGEAERLTGTKF